MPVTSAGGTAPLTNIFVVPPRVVVLNATVDRGAIVKSPASVTASVPVPLVARVMILCPPRILILPIVSVAAVLARPR